MTPKSLTVWFLLRAYPAAWRKEYGEELRSLLLSQPLSASAVGDVLLNGARQHLRNPTPCQIGLICILLWRCFSLAWNPPSPPSAVWWTHFVQVDRVVMSMFIFAVGFCEVLRNGNIFRGEQRAYYSWWLGTLIPDLIAILILAAGLGSPGPALHHILQTRSSISAQVISDLLFFTPVSLVGAIAGKISRKWLKPDARRV